MENLDFDFNFGFDEKDSEVPAMPDSFEKAVDGEISETLAALKKRAFEEAEMKLQNTSTDFWFCVYFANQDQRDKFLMAVSLLDKMEDQYIDADTFCKAVGVEIEKQKITIPKPFRTPHGAVDMVFDI